METHSKSTSLEIVPEFNSNIARFLNTANLDEKEAQKRKLLNNVSVSIVAFEGAVTAIMFTNRKVKAHEEL